MHYSVIECPEKVWEKFCEYLCQQVKVNSAVVMVQVKWFVLLLSAVKIMKSKQNDSVKFKVRCSRYLYTLTVQDKEKAEKLKQSLPPGNWLLI